MTRSPSVAGSYASACVADVENPAAVLGVARAAPDAARGTRRGTPWGGSDNDPRHPGGLLVDTPMSRLRHASRPADRPLVAMPPQAGNPGSLPIRAHPKIDRSSTGPRPFHRDPDTAPRPSRPTPATARRRPPPSRPARRQPLLVLGAHAQRHAQAPLAVARRRVHRQHPVLCIRRAPCRQPTTSIPPPLPPPARPGGRRPVSPGRPVRRARRRSPGSARACHGHRPAHAFRIQAAVINGRQQRLPFVERPSSLHALESRPLRRLARRPNNRWTRTRRVAERIAA